MRSTRGFLLAMLLTFILLSGLSLPACRSGPELPPEADAGGNVLLIIDGDVRLRRATWNGFFPASLGTVVQRGDLLQLAEGAVASVLCSDLTLWSVPPGGSQGVSNGCPPPTEPDIVRGGIALGQARSATTDIPYILSPRQTNITTATPLLRWSPVAGAAGYEVRVEGEDTNWTQTVDGNTTAIQYAGPQPLRPGETYKLIVTTLDGRSSDDEGVENLGFRLLTPEEMDEINGLTARLDALSLSYSARSLALAHIYASHTDAGRRLVTAALQEIEGLLPVVESPALYQFQGELYQSIELSHEARQAYESALALAEQTDDVAGEAAALAALGELLYSGSCQERQQAAGFLQEASNIYERLGDSARVAEVAAQKPDNPTPVCPTPAPEP